MRIRIAVDSKRILEALNYDLPSVSEMNQMKYEYLETGGSWPQDKIRRLGRSNTASILRSMVDKWLDTGRTMDGGECPSKRSLDPSLRWEVVMDYFEKHPPGVLYSSEPVGIQFLICEVFQHSRDWPDLLDVTRQEAEKFFVALWCDDWKNRLCKCRFRGCGLYFLHDKPRERYKSGTYCRAHQNAGTARAAMTKRRSRIKAELIEFAAAQLIRWGATCEWQRDTKQKERLLHMVNRHIGKTSNPELTPIHANWLTLHSGEAERRRVELLAKSNPQQYSG